MIKKIKEFFQKRKALRASRAQLKKTREYYKILKSGAMFLDFISKDIEKMKKNNFNRKQRRRWQNEIIKKGTFSAEIVEHYSHQITLIQAEIEKRLNPVKKVK